MIMKKLVFLLFLVFNLISFSQDKLIYKDGKEELVKVLEISKTELKFKKMDNVDGPTFVCLKMDLVSVQFQNGTIESFSDEMTNLNDQDLLKYTAIKDARRYYRDYKTGMGVTMLSAVFLTPIGGIFVARKFANEAVDKASLPKLIKRRGVYGTEFVDNPYYSNEIYKENYISTAKKMKKEKTWKGFAGGTLIAAGVSGLITIIIMTINDFNSF